MRTTVTRLSGLRPLALVVAMMFAFACAAHAAIVSYSVTLDGASEFPANLSPGLGVAQVDVDATAHTMRVHILSFSGLTGTTTACHIHAPTTVAGTGTAGVATTTPYFAGFPIGVTSGSYDNTLDMTQATSYNGSYITANGGTTATAEAALFTAIADGKAYLNIHTTTFGGGEIRGFLIPGQPTANAASTWGRIKQLYR